MIVQIIFVSLTTDPGTPLEDEELLKKWLVKIEPTHQSTSTPVYVVIIFILLASSDALDQLEST